MALDLGASVYQDIGPDLNFTNDVGDTHCCSPRTTKLAFTAVSKQGYVFGTGTFRPTIEGDFFSTAGNVAGMPLDHCCGEV